jgi:acetylornithine deacetylase/succinyl-diaminopimelate desuccinylase-like protein
LSAGEDSPVDFLRKLVEFPTFEREGMKACARYLSAELRSLGFEVEVDRLDNVYGEKNFEGTEDAFLINSHFDTVPSTPRWVRSPLKASVEGERVYGLGTSDDKGSIASILHVLRKLRRCRFRKLELLFSNYEDNSIVLDGDMWLGTPYFLSHHKLESKSGVNVEGTVENGRLMVSLGCGGRVGFTVTTIGKEAHSSDPRKGRNAIYEMVKVMEALRKLPPAIMTLDEYEAYTELNVSKIQGGIAMNVVPGECTITCERRVLPNENWETVKGKVEETLRGVESVEFNVSYMKPQRSYLIDKTHPAVTLAEKSIQRTLGYVPKLKVGSGRTDSTYLNEAGIKTVILGPGEIAHVADEYVNTSRLEEFTRVLYDILSAPSD